MTVTALPGGFDVKVHPDNPLTVDTVWPSTLAGRTFDVALGSTTLPVTVSTTHASWTFPTARAGTVSPWRLRETTGGAAIPTPMGGKVSYTTAYDAAGDDMTVTVLVGDSIDVTVQLGALILGTTLDGGTPAGSGSDLLDGGTP